MAQGVEARQTSGGRRVIGKWQYGRVGKGVVRLGHAWASAVRHLNIL